MPDLTLDGIACTRPSALQNDALGSGPHDGASGYTPSQPKSVRFADFVTAQSPKELRCESSKMIDVMEPVTPNRSVLSRCSKKKISFCLKHDSLADEFQEVERRDDYEYGSGLGFDFDALSPHEATPLESATSSRIAILVNGSRGDMQPLLALACQLRNYGHQVRILTNANLVEWCAQHGVPAKAVFVDQQAVIKNMGGLSGKLLQGSLRGKKAAKEWLHRNPEVCTSAEDALHEFLPDLTIANFQSFAPAWRYEMEMGSPFIFVGLQREIFDILAFDDCKPPRPSFLACSSLLNSSPVPDKLFKGGLAQTGPWLLEEEPSMQDLAKGGHYAEVAHFLAEGSPPIAVGWGSMLAEGLEPTDMLILALRSLQQAERRGVIIGGWAQLDVLGLSLQHGRQNDFGANVDAQELLNFVEGNICFASSVPHAWLFPRCSCIVHHGGAGTTHAALLAGKPSVITPVFGDQYAHAEAIRSLNAGFGFDVALPEISVQQLVQAMLKAEKATPQAQILSAKIRQEDGKAKAAAAIDTFLREEVQAGRWKSSFQKIHGNT